MDTSHFKIRLWPIVVVTVILSSLAFFIPVPAGADGLSFHTSASLSLLNLGLFVPGAWIFISALPSFRKRLRTAYSFIAGGFLLISLGTVQYPVVAILNLSNSAWVTEGWAEGLFILGTVASFIGAWLYARLVGVKNVWITLGMMVAGILLLMWIVTLLPHAAMEIPEADLDKLLAFNALEGSCMLAGAILLLQVKQRTNLIYNRAIAWLVVSLILSMVGCYAILIAFLVGAVGSWFFAYNVFLLPFIISGWSWLRSAEAFHNVASGTDIPLVTEIGERTFFGRPIEVTEKRPVTCVDVVAFLASLCSNANDVDKELDTFRFVTANNQPGEPIGAADQERLAKVALAIEQYLIERDPVRTFTAQELHNLVNERYKELVEAPAFWQMYDSAAAPKT